MKYLSLILILALLAGCASQQPLPIETTSVETVSIPTSAPATEAPTSQPTTQPAPPDPLETLLESMSLEQKVGQLFLVACPENPLEAIKRYHLGGFILFDQDFQGKTPESLRSTLSSYQNASAVPMLFAVDEEGGSVCRVSSHDAFRNSRFPSPRKLLAQGGLDLLLETESEKAQLLRDLGILVNMAPVCDITLDPDAFMYSRSLGLDPQETADAIAEIVEIMAQNRIGSVLKHFPGYGNNTDTHVAVATDIRSLDELESADLIPFQAGITVGCDAILVSHTIVTAMDEQAPATLSPDVHQYLREKMGFTGVIITDDLQMDAITDIYGDAEAAVLAVLAGNDILCSWEYQAQYEAVLDAVQSGRLSEEQLNASVLRILKWKQRLGLFPSN